MPETVLVNGNAYSLLKLLGKGKGGYSYLAQMADGQQVVVKQIHHELLSFYKYPLMQYVLTIILSLVWISLKGIFISVWYKVWYSSYKKCGTAPACKNK